MVREVTVQADIPGLTPQDVFDCTFSGPEAALEYHSECDGDPTCEVGEWQNGVREVLFQMRVTAPAAITRLIGVETITVREVSTRSDEGADIVVHAKPLLDFPGSSKFVTASCLRISPTSTGCQMSVVVTCEARGPWGLIGTIEETMATQAAATIEGFAEFCQRWCATHGAAAENAMSPFAKIAEQAPQLRPLQIGIAHPSMSGSGDSEDEFFDTNSATPRSHNASSCSGGTVAALRADLVALSARVHTLEILLCRQKQQNSKQNGIRSDIRQPDSRQWQWSAPLAASAVVVLVVVSVQYGRWSALSAAKMPNP